jgi:hypothetical protein
VDGFPVQGWAKTALAQDLEAGLGIGLYSFFDSRGCSYKAGVGGLASAEIKYWISNPWFLSLRANAVFGTTNNTVGILGGFGRSFPDIQDRLSRPRFGEFSLLASPKSLEAAYRTGLGIPHLEISGSYIIAAKNEPFGGPALQLVLIDTFFGKSLEVGMGAGPFFNTETNSLVPIISMFASHSLQFISKDLANWSLGIGYARIVHSQDENKKCGDTDIVGVKVTYYIL